MHPDVTVYAYDASERLIGVTHPGGSEESFEYDDLGRRTAYTDRGGHITRFSYDALGQLIEVQDALGGKTKYSYDYLGNLDSQVDAMNRKVRFEYDARGRRSATVQPNGDRREYEYNARGELVKEIDSLGEAVRFEYDTDGRLLRQENPDGTVHSYTYSPGGLRTTASGPSGQFTYSYDSNGRLLAVEQSNGERIGYSWDRVGNRQSVSLALEPGQSLETTYEYDAENQIVAMRDSLGDEYLFSYDPAGRVESIEYPNGIRTDLSYDSVSGQLVDVVSTNQPGELVLSYSYGLDVEGLPVELLEQDGKRWSWSYDALHQIQTEELLTPAGDLQFGRQLSYDAVGNRKSQEVTTLEGARTDTYVYDSRNRLIQAGSVDFEWDANGALIRKGEVSYDRDGLSRLAGVSADDRSIEIRYTPDGDMTWEAIHSPSGSIERTFLVDSTQPPLSHILAERGSEDGRVIYQIADGRVYGLESAQNGQTESRYYHYDATGSVRALSDENGEISDEYTYGSFGEALEFEGESIQPYRFAGQRLSDNGLYYLRARWLDPEVGRFVSADPVLGLASWPATQNRYVYAVNSPHVVSDPSGLFPTMAAAALVALGVAAVISMNFPPLDIKIPLDRIPAFDVSRKGMLFIAGWEAWDPNLYDDDAGHCTIGFGRLVHLGKCSGNASERPYLSGISVREGFQFLRDDIKDKALIPLRGLTGVPLNQFELDALSSLVYNLGPGKLRSSDTIRLINRGRSFRRTVAGEKQIRQEWSEWRMANGVVMNGLVERRRNEIEIFFTRWHPSDGFGPDDVYNIRWFNIPAW